MKPLNELSAGEAAAAIKAGETTSEALVGACLERIDAREKEVGAWQFLDTDLVLAQARACDSRDATGLLHGVPIAVKDIIDTVDMPTTHGSPIYDGNRTPWSAACVTLVRDAGAVIMGKSVTTEFAAFTPGKTANPHNLAHTPGGSSSGSAAAVADFMVPIGFATQTAASIIRPATFCGVVGYKPSYGNFSLAGIKTFAHSLDTLGTITRTLEDAALVRAALLGVPPALPKETPISSLRIGLCRTHQWSDADDVTHNALEDAAHALATAGAVVSDVDLSSEFADLVDVQQTVMAFEGARNYAFEHLFHGDRLSERLIEIIDKGNACSYDHYLKALRKAESCHRLLDAVFDDYDLLLSPAAMGAAPEGLDATGNPIFSRMWTLLHVPTVTIPISQAPNGLPIGAQFVARFHADDQLLQMAEAVTDALA
jgi:Asp-tRNA(Asn)/Glu-tRNA(Gln) amidotransferase A subunit family amidase